MTHSLREIPVRGIHYDELVDIHQFVDMDKAFLDIRGTCDVVNPDGKTFEQLFDVTAMDYYGGLEYEKQYIGWLVLSGQKRYWVRFSLADMVKDYLEKKHV